MNWSNKVVFISGAASGIGEALADELAEAGANLALMDIDGEPLNEVGSRLERITEVEAMVGDVADQDDVSRCFETAEAVLAFPEVVVANAGLGYTTPVPDLDVDEFKRLMRVNYDGVVHVISEVLDRMIASQSGHLVVTSSMAAFTPFKGGAAYCGSKAAVLRLAESLRLDLRNDPISVMTIHPGWVRTPMTEKYPESLRFFEITPEDAARRIKLAIESNEDRVIFPWQMKLLAKIMAVLPRRLVDYFRERMAFPVEIT